MAGFLQRFSRGLAPTRRRGRLVERIHRNGTGDAEFRRHRLLIIGAAQRLRSVMRERRPRQSDAGALRLGRARLGFGAADRGDAAFAACNSLCRLMQIADRTLATNRAVICVVRSDAEAGAALSGRIAVAPAQEIDDVEGLDLAQQFRAAILLGPRQRLDHQCQRFKAGGEIDRMIGDFADADDDGNAIFGWWLISHWFSFHSFSVRNLPTPIVSSLRGALATKQSRKQQSKTGLLRRGVYHRAEGRTRWLLAMTASRVSANLSTSLRATGSRECAPDAKLREAI